ncbi:glycosyltransferase family 2 protein [Desulfobacter curvatus]|uniref:glycosyltransferase family 2 protein n=1 Tax=Desulfobacter curvatus TaxID=2290 RepID=UPI00037B2433|nr:glycosyltransferase family 2 protein [Desulfobacter curvatus]
MNISVIVTTFNRPDSLKKVLEGLLNQTRLPCEIIVADDGSLEETSHLVNQMAMSSPNCPVRHVWHEDRGFRAAEIRNKAILKSSGDYIISLDGDCIPDRYFIQDHLQLAKPGYFFQGKRVLVEKALQDSFNFSHTQKTRWLIANALKGQVSNAHHLLRLPFVPVVTTTKMSGIRSCNMGFFRKDLFAVNGFNQAFQGWGREDSELAARLYNYGLRRREHPFMAVCFHLWHEENNRSNLERNDQHLENTQRSGSYWCSNGLADEKIGDKEV